MILVITTNLVRQKGFIGHTNQYSFVSCVQKIQEVIQSQQQNNIYSVAALLGSTDLKSITISMFASQCWCEKEITHKSQTVSYYMLKMLNINIMLDFYCESLERKE